MSEYVVVNGHALNCGRWRADADGECDCLEDERCDVCGSFDCRGSLDCGSFDEGEEF